MTRFLFFLIIVTAIPVLWWLWWRIPIAIATKKHVASEKDRTEVEDWYRKAIGQAIGGAALLVTLNVSLQQYLLATRSQHIDQYQKGFDALKGDDVAAHIGGIYGLEILSQTVPDWRKAVLMGLSAAAVDFSRTKKAKSLDRISPDAEAALLVIARAPNKAGTRYPLATGGFHGVPLPYAHLNGANLEGADLSGSDFYKAQLYGANFAFANLNGASLAGADLSHARLVKAKLCPGMNVAVVALQNGRAERVSLEGAKLYSATLTGASLFMAKLGGANFSDAEMGEVNLQDAAMSSTTSFKSAKLLRARLEFANAQGVDFSPYTEIDGRPKPLKRTTLAGAKLDYANLAGANFTLVDLKGASFVGANLTNANFSRAEIDSTTNFSQAHFCNTKMEDNKIRSDHCSIQWLKQEMQKLQCDID